MTILDPTDKVYLLINNDQLQKKVADLESQLAEVTADNAALLEQMKQNCFQPGDVNDVCVFCGARSPWHSPACIVSAWHPGSHILHRLSL